MEGDRGWVRFDGVGTTGTLKGEVQEPEVSRATVDGSNAVPFVFISPGGTDGFDGDVDVGVSDIDGDGGFADFDCGTFGVDGGGVVGVSSGSAIFSSMVLSGSCDASDGVSMVLSPVGGRFGLSPTSVLSTR